jgi:aspartate kinase
MHGMHTVEKIGGTSMSQFGDVMNNVIISNREGVELYNRIFVVSAYGGITNLLLENKKDGAPGVYGQLAGGGDWLEAFEILREKMIAYNRSFESIGLDVDAADNFINKRLDSILICIKDLTRLHSYGHFPPEDYLPASREILSSVGEVHSAYNSTAILKANGVNAQFIDLSGWMDTDLKDFDDMIHSHFDEIDYTEVLPIVTGYVKIKDGIMDRFDRGYSEITFSKIAVITNACEGIIHKEFHLSTGDPVLIGLDKVKVIGHLNFDVADQLSDMDMEAIHSKASKEMELHKIPIRVKNVFEPEHPGTIIEEDYISAEPKADIICGRNDIVAIEVTDPEMVGSSGYDYHLLECLYENDVSYIAKSTNANTITHIIPEKTHSIDKIIETLTAHFPGARINSCPVALVSVIGSNMKEPGFLRTAADALLAANVNVLAVEQTMQQVNMQFVIDRKDFDNAQFALHRAFIEEPI